LKTAAGVYDTWVAADANMAVQPGQMLTETAGQRIYGHFRASRHKSKRKAMDSINGMPGAAPGLADLGQVPLADLQVMKDPALVRTLSRIVPDTPGQQVTVAAFNSSI
jgi:FXSXX-COOH protein